MGDLIIFKNFYAVNKKTNIHLRNHSKSFMGRRCLISNTIESMLMIHKPKCENNNIATIRTSSESPLHWKEHFHNNSLGVRIIADFAADNEFEDNKAVCKETIDFCKQNPVCNGYCIKSELNDVLQSGYYKSPLGYEKCRMVCK